MIMQRFVWDLEQRNKLENLLKEGLNVSRISKLMNLSSATIYKEIQKGVSLEDYGMGKFIKYSAQKSIDNQLEEYRRFLIEGKRD